MLTRRWIRSTHPEGNLDQEKVKKGNLGETGKFKLKSLMLFLISQVQRLLHPKRLAIYQSKPQIDIPLALLAPLSQV